MNRRDMLETEIGLLANCCNSPKTSRELAKKMRITQTQILHITEIASDIGLLNKLQVNKTVKKPRFMFSTTQKGRETIVAFNQYFALRFGKLRNLGDVEGLKLLFSTFPGDDTDPAKYRNALLDWLSKLKSISLAKIGLIEVA